MTAPAPGRGRVALIALLLAAAAIAWLASAAGLLRAAREEARFAANQRLQDAAQSLLREVRRAAPAGDPATATEPRFRYQVWSASGALLQASPSAPREPIIALTQGGSGHQHITLNGTPLHVYAASSDDRAVQVQVAAPDDGAGFAFERVAPALLWLFAACTVGLIVLPLVLYVRLTRAVAALTARLSDHPVDAIAAPAAQSLPAELRPLVAQFDALRSHFAKLLDAERRFAAAAAHELRTPLAAVRVQAQVAERARTPADAREALALLQVCVERASRTIDQLLTLAQFESTPVPSATAPTVDLAALAARVVQDVSPLLRTRNIELTTDLQPASVAGLEHGLAALLRNLLDNAARHTPPRSHVRVTSGVAGDMAFIAVEDSGPGIEPAERARVFERFYRLPTHDGDSDGLGVGLSIVQSVARAHDGRVELADSDLGGLRATFFLSAPSPSRQGVTGQPVPTADATPAARKDRARER